MDETAQRNIALMREAYDRYNDGDGAFLASLLVPDVEWVSHGDPRLMPTSGRRRGIEAVGEYFALLQRDWVVERHDGEEFFGAGDRVVVRTRVRIRRKATGAIIWLDKADFWTVRDGRIHAFQEMFDSYPLHEVVEGRHA
jgi:ketosteroid isomerase-like protein